MIFNFFLVNKDIKVVGADLNTICLHVSIAFLYCLSLSAPPLSTMKLLPSCISKPAFPRIWAEIHPVHTGIFLLTSGSWQKTSGSAWRWRLHFLSRGGPGAVSSSSFYVWEIPTPVKGPVWLCTDQQQSYRWFLRLTMWSSTWFSLWTLQLWLGVVGCFTSGWGFIAQSGCSDKGTTISMPGPTWAIVWNWRNKN